MVALKEQDYDKYARKMKKYLKWELIILDDFLLHTITDEREIKILFQRPEMWKLYNTKIKKGESIRVFPISNWTEKDIWQYIKRENIDIVPLYFAAERPVVYRDGNIIMVDDL